MSHSERPGGTESDSSSPSSLFECTGSTRAGPNSHFERPGGTCGLRWRRHGEGTWRAPERPFAREPLYIYIYIYTKVLVRRGVLGPSTCRGAFAIAVRRCRQSAQNGCSALPWCCQCTQKGCSGCLSLIRCGQGAQNGSKRLKNAQKDAKRLKKALEKAVRACPVPPVRSKRLFEPASVPPVRSKRLFERAVRDRRSQKLVSVALCSEPLHSALLCSVHGYARVHTSQLIIAILGYKGAGILGNGAI